MASIRTLPSTASVDDVCEVIDRDGGAIVENMISFETLDRLIAVVRPHLDSVAFSDGGFMGTRTRRTTGLLGITKYAADFVLQPHFLGAAEKLLPRPFKWVLGEDEVEVMPTIQIGNTAAAELFPGEKAQPLHRDDGVAHWVHPGPQSQLQVLYALTDFTYQNGATLVIPGSHMWDDQRRPKLEEAVPAEMKRGSGLIYYGSTYHAGGANRTEKEIRMTVAISFTLGYLRQEENQYLVIPHAMVREYPQRLQELIGYKTCPPFCGWVNFAEPSIVLTDPNFRSHQAKNLL